MQQTSNITHRKKEKEKKYFPWLKSPFDCPLYNIIHCQFVFVFCACACVFLLQISMASVDDIVSYDIVHLSYRSNIVMWRLTVM